ncbi:BTB/POZ/MATH-domain protein [Rhynchospora pubera]|uniref:BTB/POZ/MATH-domain protein n=1 Tax=Rhynchospora pubera TaxID=906938 RepID=A0AAV8GZE7_9POAL|nr:BTB/POZ/MATH-domain protein [Rhynchospora pubera]KAJ4809211.1 BTB/POZ/MATH-domain protein [Rhynchospora pubera]
MTLSTDDSLDAPETVSTLRVEKVKGSHLFKIMGYSLQRNIERGKFLESATFSVGGYDWSITFYPNGFLNAQDDYTSVFVCLKTEAQLVQAQPSFTFLDQEGNPLSEKRTTEVFNFNNTVYKDADFGYKNFVKRSTFDSVLKDDCLLIRCTVTVFKDFLVEVEPAYPLRVPPPDVQQLSLLLEAGYGADVIFEVNGVTFNAHKCILALRSQVFHAQFFGPLKEKSDTIIKIEDMDAQVFKSLLHFMYSQTIPEFEEINGSEKKHNMAQHLLVAADRYDLERLKIICQNILYDTMDRSNVVSLLSLAEMHNCIHLKIGCLKFLACPEILGDVVATKEFQRLVRSHPLILKELFEVRMNSSKD